MTATLANSIKSTAAVSAEDREGECYNWH